MGDLGIAVISGLVLAYALLAQRLSRANLTAPMFSLLAGVLVFSRQPVVLQGAAVHLIAEIALVLVLFHDASTVRLARLRGDPGIAARLLLIGFPLALVATYLVTDSMLGVGVAGQR